METIHQCPQCDSKGEIKTMNNDIEQKKLTVEHVRKLESEIQNLLKQKAELQDQVDKYINKEIENGKDQASS